MLQATHLLQTASGNIAALRPASSPTFAFDQKHKYGATAVTAASSEPELSFPVPSDLYFRRVYFGFFFDDYSAAKFSGALIFLLQNRPVATMPVRYILPGFAAEFDWTFRPVQFCTKTQSGLAHTGEFSTGNAGPDMMRVAFQTNHSDGGYVINLDVSPIKMAIACDRVELRLTEFSATAIETGFYGFSLGVFSQSLPL